MGAGFEALKVQSRKRKVRREHIACRHPKHLLQQRQGPHNAARGFQRFACAAPLVGITQLHGGGGCHADASDSGRKDRPQGRFDLIAQPTGVDDRRRHACQSQSLQGIPEQGAASHFEQWFGRVVGEGAHALAAPGGQQHGLGPTTSFFGGTRCSNWGGQRACFRGVVHAKECSQRLAKMADPPPTLF